MSGCNDDCNDMYYDLRLAVCRDVGLTLVS